MSGGRTMRQNVEVFARTHPVEGPAMLAQFTPGPVPVAGAMASAAFELLSATRSVGMAGPRALTLADVQSYSSTIAPLSGRDARWVLEQDAVYLSEVAKDG